MEENSKKKILTRLRRIEGQVKGIQRMIEEGQECEQILNQIAAVRAAVNQVGLAVVRCYARDCILQSRDKDTFERALLDSVEMMARVLK